ncbi:hypothetical protein GCM10022252_73780 [Streptosporangium oxazolinicum]|uniref:Pentapeptide repeat-containing protein n=1 Tax=Streptosporangium oxazolinicum TaxID=909287 RepID=A0ABP8BKB3_9ACTN
MQRLAADSPRDRNTIREVLSAYVRNHDLCTPDPGTKPPGQCTTTGIKRAQQPHISPSTDTIAALTVALLLRDGSPDKPQLVNFRGVRFPRADLAGLSLDGVNLSGTDLWGADLSHADLDSADLNGADLRGAILGEATLIDATLSSANFSDTDLSKAYLLDGDMFDLSTGIVEKMVRQEAIVNENTKF